MKVHDLGFTKEENGESYRVADSFKQRPNLKPDAKLIGANGNIYNLLAICRQSLHQMPNAFNELTERVYKCESYDKALQIIQEYVNVI